MNAPAKLREWINSTGRKQTWVSEQIGVDNSRLSAWLTGRNIPSGAARKSLADLTGLDIAEKEAWV